MNVSTPSYFPVLPPHLVPAMRLVREQVGTALCAGMADYAQRAATRSHSEAASVLHELLERLPHCDSVVITEGGRPRRRVAGRLLADEAAHDRYFNVLRVSQSEGTAFLLSILKAATLFHIEMASAYGLSEAQISASLSSTAAGIS